MISVLDLIGCDIEILSEAKKFKYYIDKYRYDAYNDYRLIYVNMIIKGSGAI